MTDHLPPPSDEDLSAALDGEADADALARIAAHPDSVERSSELERASRHLRTSATPELAPELADELIGAALRSPIAPGSPARRAQPAGWLVAAVIAVLVGVGLTLVWTGRDNGNEQAFNTVSDSIAADEQSPADAEEASPEAESLDGGAGLATADAATGVGPLVDLGTFESGDDLRRALATSTIADAAAPLSSRAAGADDAAVARCAQQLSVALDLPTPPQAQGVASVDGTEVLVYEFAIESFDDGQPTTLVAAVDTDACAQVVVFER